MSFVINIHVLSIVEELENIMSEKMNNSIAGGANYIRWGRTTCPDTDGTELLYRGVAAGAFFAQLGGGSNYLCLPDEPEFLNVTAGNQNVRSRVYGAQYQAALPSATCSITMFPVLPVILPYEETRS